MVDLVTRHVTLALYQLTPDDVQGVCRRTAHPLRRIDKARIASVAGARDWYPTFAFTHLFHHYLELFAKLPTWDDFYHFLFGTARGNELFGNEIREEKNRLLRIAAKTGRTDINETLVGDALRWRVGLAYYSFLREVYSVVSLRSREIDVHVHPLADAVCRVDAWVDDTIISLWVTNQLFRTKTDGRKLTAAQLLKGSAQFDFLDIDLDKATKYGRVHLPSEEKIDHAADKIRRHQATHAIRASE